MRLQRRVLGEEREIHAVRVERAVERRARAKPDDRHGAGASRGWGMTRALHGKSSALIHAPAQIDKHLIGIAYLDQSMTRVLEVDDHIRSYRQDDGEGDGVQHIQTTPYRHVVARKQRTRESQRALQREDDHWWIKSSCLCSRRGDVEHRVECGQKQQRRLSCSSFPRGGDSEGPYFALQIRRSRQRRSYGFHVRHVRYPLIDLDPRVQVAAEEIAHGRLGVCWEQRDP